MTNKDWNPDLYLKFNRERIQPTIDLVSRINFSNPKRIIDIGCGPGNSTQILAKRWQDSKITGIDKSPAMINTAQRNFPNYQWKLLDIGNDEIEKTYDIVFSNAVIQWVPNHLKLLQKFKKILTINGVLAVQIPLFFDMALGQSIRRISKENPWAGITKSVNNLFTILNYSEYFDILSKLFIKFEIWETNYIHTMASHYSILEMIRSTGLRPYLDRLKKDEDKNAFEEKVLADIKKDYPLQENGKVLLPFKRLFFIAHNSNHKK